MTKKDFNNQKVSIQNIGKKILAELDSLKLLTQAWEKVIDGIPQEMKQAIQEDMELINLVDEMSAALEEINF